jgi:hypothetical protein
MRLSRSRQPDRESGVQAPHRRFGPANGIGLAVAVGIAYLAATIWLTWPLGSVAASQLPMVNIISRGDLLLMAWALVHASRTLVTAPWSLPDANIYHPTPRSFFYGETGLGAVPYFAPVFLATGNVSLAINVLFLGCVAMTALAVHAATHHWSRSHLAGFVAGATFLTAPWVLWTWVPAAPNYAVLQYLPFIVVLAARRLKTWRATVGLAALVVVQGLTSAYVAAATLLPLAALAAARLVRRSTRAPGLRLVAALALASVVLLAASWGYVLVRRDNPRLAVQSLYTSTRLAWTVIPDQLFQTRRPTALLPVVWVLIACGLFVRLVGRDRIGDPPGMATAWRHCGLWMAVGLYFSLTPIVVWHGRQITLPHVLVSPLLQPFRGVHRLGVAMLIGASILAGLACAECIRCLPDRHRRTAASTFAAIVLAAMYVSYRQPIAPLVQTVHRAAPYPVFAVAPPTGPIADVLARSGGPLLELPIAPNGVPHVVAMFASIYHRHPLLNGYHGYWPAEFPDRMRLACRLPDPVALDDLRRRTGLELVLVHTAFLYSARHAESRAPYTCPPNTQWDSGPRGAEMGAWLQIKRTGSRSDLRLVAEDGNDLLFQVVPPSGRQESKVSLTAAPPL